MDDHMTGLVEFYRARLDEDAEVAQATRKNEQYVDGTGRWFASHNNAITSMAPHRAVAEVEAKRQIVEAYEAQIAERQRLGVLRDAELAKGDELAPEVARLTGGGIGVNSWINHLGWVVRVMATTYADHPDYREEWRP